MSSKVRTLTFEIQVEDNEKTIQQVEQCVTEFLLYGRQFGRGCRNNPGFSFERPDVDSVYMKAVSPAREAYHVHTPFSLPTSPSLKHARIFATEAEAQEALELAKSYFGNFQTRLKPHGGGFCVQSAFGDKNYYYVAN